MTIGILAFALFHSVSFAQWSKGLSKIDFGEKKFTLRNGYLLTDSQKVETKKTTAQKTSVGGLFLSPGIGAAIPMGKFGDLSNSGFYYSFKLEIAHSKIYPFILGIVYESQSNGGNADFTTVNFLTQFTTDITYYGGSIDFLLNKYLKSDFTMPVLGFEVKYANVKRTVTPDTSVPEVPREESLLTYAASMMFTLYVIDVGAKYTFAKDYSSLTLSGRFHLPLFRF